MITSFEHPSRVARWHNGAFEVLPEASSATQTVWFPFHLEDEQKASDGGWEGLLTQPAAADQAVVVAIPAFANDVNLGDLVEVALQAEGALVAIRRLSDSGRFPFRVRFTASESAGVNTRWQELTKELEPHGCWFDVCSPDLVTLSADLAVLNSVVEYLEAGQQHGRWNYEAGRTRPPPGLGPDLDGEIPWIG